MGRSQEKISKRFKGKVTPVVQDVVMPLTLDVVFDYIIHAASNADPNILSIERTGIIKAFRRRTGFSVRYSKCFIFLLLNLSLSIS